MKNKMNKVVGLFIVTFVILFTSCNDDSNDYGAPLTIDEKVAVLETQEWLLKDFEDSVMYTFSNGERFTYYAVDNEFTSEAIPGTIDYTISGDLLTMDFHFGNVKTYEVEFTCNNSIVNFYADGIIQLTLYERGSDYLNCI